MTLKRRVIFVIQTILSTMERRCYVHPTISLVNPERGNDCKGLKDKGNCLGLWNSGLEAVQITTIFGYIKLAPFGIWLHDFV